jgi:hypothetical protein
MRQKPRFRVNRKKAKTVLRLPDLEHAKTAVLNGSTSADAQRGDRHAIDEFVDWYCSEPRLAFNRIVVLRYRSYLESRQLAPGTVSLRLGAVRRLAYEAADCGEKTISPGLTLTFFTFTWDMPDGRKINCGPRCNWARGSFFRQTPPQYSIPIRILCGCR